MSSASCSRRAFTLVELLVVIAIIALLAAGVSIAIGLLSSRAKTENSRKLVLEVAQGIDQYLLDWGRLGGLGLDGDDFEADPWGFLGRERLARDETAYIDLDAEDLGIGDPPRRASLTTGEVILDAFGRPLVFSIANEARHGREYTRRVEVRSTRGTPSDEQDDLVYAYELDDAGWSWQEP